jgi:hypothetical protein
MIDATIKEYCSSNNIKFSKMEYRELRKTFSKQRKPVPAKFSGIINILDENCDSFICGETHII